MYVLYGASSILIVNNCIFILQQMVMTKFETYELLTGRVFTHNLIFNQLKVEFIKLFLQSRQLQLHLHYLEAYIYKISSVNWNLIWIVM